MLAAIGCRRRTLVRSANRQSRSSTAPGVQLCRRGVPRAIAFGRQFRALDNEVDGRIFQLFPASAFGLVWPSPSPQGRPAAVLLVALFLVADPALVLAPARMLFKTQ